MTSYAANNLQSSPSIGIASQPLAQITAQITNAQGQPITGNTASLASAAFTWTPVSGAQCYVVLIYTNNPSFNDTPYNILTLGTGATSGTLNSVLSPALVPGTTDWWSVGAFNTVDPNAATAISYTAYQSVTVTN